VHLRSKSSPLQSPKSTNELQDQRPDGNKNPDGNKGCRIETTRRELFKKEHVLSRKRDEKHACAEGLGALVPAARVRR
jgi:hypothetical protein